MFPSYPFSSSPSSFLSSSSSSSPLLNYIPSSTFFQSPCSAPSVASSVPSFSSVVSSSFCSTDSSSSSSFVMSSSFTVPSTSIVIPFFSSSSFSPMPSSSSSFSPSPSINIEVNNMWSHAVISPTPFTAQEMYEIALSTKNVWFDTQKPVPTILLSIYLRRPCYCTAVLSRCGRLGIMGNTTPEGARHAVERVTRHIRRVLRQMMKTDVAVGKFVIDQLVATVDVQRSLLVRKMLTDEVVAKHLREWEATIESTVELEGRGFVIRLPIPTSFNANTAKLFSLSYLAESVTLPSTGSSSSSFSPTLENSSIDRQQKQGEGEEKRRRKRRGKTCEDTAEGHHDENEWASFFPTSEELGDSFASPLPSSKPGGGGRTSCIMVYNSGKVLVKGCRSEEEVKEVVAKVWPLLTMERFADSFTKRKRKSVI